MSVLYYIYKKCLGYIFITNIYDIVFILTN